MVVWNQNVTNSNAESFVHIFQSWVGKGWELGLDINGKKSQEQHFSKLLWYLKTIIEWHSFHRLLI